MSKIHNEFDGIIRKSKFKRMLRRKETEQKKHTRLKNAEKGIYPFMDGGYFVRDSVKVGIKKKITVPASTKKTGYIVREDTPIHYGDRILWVKTCRFVQTGTETVPEHEKTVKAGSYYRQIKPRAVRMKSIKKDYRKLASRKIRRTDDVGDGCTYKKHYDIKWQLW